MNEIKYIEWENSKPVMFYNSSCTVVREGIKSNGLALRIGVTKGSFTYKIIDKTSNNTEEQIKDKFISRFNEYLNKQSVDSNGVYKIDINDLKNYINEYQRIFEIEELEIKNIELDEESQEKMEQYIHLKNRENQETNCGFTVVYENNANNLENSIKNSSNKFNYIPIIIVVAVVAVIVITGLVISKLKK